MRSNKEIVGHQITVNVNQAAEILGVNRSTIIRLVNKGAIPKVQLTETRVGILRSDLSAYVKKHRSKVDCSQKVAA